MEKYGCEPVCLEPFVHQVGGSSHMFSYDSTTVCKPLNEREYHFYQTVPECLKEFMPDFKGVVEVAFVEDSDGYYNITLAGTPTGGSYGKNGKRKVFNKSGNSPGSSGGEGKESDSDSDSNHCCPKRVAAEAATKSDDSSRVHAATSSRQHIDSGQTSFELKDGEAKSTCKSKSKCSPNPWHMRLHKREMDKMREASSGLGPKKFILLENVVSQLHYPCILDLKMGTRQHGDDESDEKREKKIKRCLTTTSSSIGFRVCGMQIYQRDTRQFICQNKYAGRKLSAETIRDALYQFLNDGVCLCTDLIDQILERLKQLYSLLSKQNSFRFYSSSLLIMYDGKERKTTDARTPTASVTAYDKESNAKTWKKNITEDLDWSHTSRTSEKRSDPVKHVSPDHSRSHDSLGKNSRQETNHRLVDVRMIDFAHTTHQGFHHDRQRSGPDTGYLFGLTNLIKIFEEIKDQNS
ncbi:inositol hexakisphosphate kinase 1-like [Lineus longissimus]|uniref:inositol hexakisphosphate kinase 1-like n=1 Tax=Lineus longissimus TaxID=88925 RepID=UPI002B4DB07B